MYFPSDPTADQRDKVAEVKQTHPGEGIHVLYDMHHKVSSLILSHQNTQNFVKYEVI